MAKGSIVSPHASFSEKLLQTNGGSYEKVVCLSSPNVFTIRHRDSGAVLVAKVIDLESTDDEELEHVKKGVRVTKMLKHENLLPFFACFIDFKDLWIVSPHCELGSAGDLSKPSGIEDETCLAYILRDVLTALDYLHQRAVIHRAVRGSHILVNRNGRCVLSGLKYCTSVIKNGKWQMAIHEYPSNATPNLNWLSPEVLEQNLLGYDSKSDIYSLGITCCELANGVVPFDNLHPTEMLLDKLTGHYPKPLDSTCAHFITLPEDLNDEEREKYKVYESRRFSDLFHAFTVDLCLVGDPHKRLTAAQLLNHRFIKQLKKAAPASVVLGRLARKLSERFSGHDSISDSGPEGERRRGLQDIAENTAGQDEFTWTFPKQAV